MSYGPTAEHFQTIRAAACEALEPCDKALREGPSPEPNFRIAHYNLASWRPR